MSLILAFFFADLQTKSKYVDWSSASVQGYYFIYLNNKEDINALFCSVAISFFIVMLKQQETRDKVWVVVVGMNMVKVTSPSMPSSPLS